ncbi:unnamed protein product, partial [Allacma fusca]
MQKPCDSLMDIWTRGRVAECRVKACEIKCRYLSRSYIYLWMIWFSFPKSYYSPPAGQLQTSTKAIMPTRRNHLGMRLTLQELYYYGSFYIP